MEHFPAELDVSRCVVLFPSAGALDVEEVEPDSIDHAFIIDSRWCAARAPHRMRAVRVAPPP